MKYIIDAQLPNILKDWLLKFGVEAIHTLDLPDGNDTEDLEIISVSETGNYIVISKDSDFVQYRIERGTQEAARCLNWKYQK